MSASPKSNKPFFPLPGKRNLAICLIFGFASAFLFNRGYNLVHAVNAVQLSVSSATGAAPGSSVDLNISIDPSGSSLQPTIAQFDILYNTANVASIAWKADGPAATAAGKSGDCATPSAGDFRCLILGFNNNTIGQGVLGTITVNLTNTTLATSIPIQFSGAGASDAAADSVPVSTAGGTIAVTQNQPPANNPPTVSLTSPASGATVSGTGVTVAATAAAAQGANIIKVVFYLDSAILATANATPYSVSWDTTAAANGSHTLTAEAFDSNGNTTTSAAVNVTVNNVIAVPVSCQLTSSASVQTNQAVNFTAGGGNGQYVWTASGGNPASGGGSTFSTLYAASGAYTVTVSSNGQSANCASVTVSNPVTPVSCSASPVSVTVNGSVTFTAAGGDGQNYSWTVSGGSVISFNGKSFTTAFSGPGSYTATVSSGGSQNTCAVQAQAQTFPTLSCAAQTGTGNINQAVTFTASGGNGQYTWTSSGVPASGSGTIYNPSFSGAGNQAVVVQSGDSQTASCAILINPPPQQYRPLLCSVLQNPVNLNQQVTFVASGGSGSYNWTGGGAPASSNGGNFTTFYSSAGVFTAIVTSSDGQTAACSVTVNNLPPINNPPPIINNPPPSNSCPFGAGLCNNTTVTNSGGGTIITNISNNCVNNSCNNTTVNNYSNGNSSGYVPNFPPNLPSGFPWIAGIPAPVYYYNRR